MSKYIDRAALFNSLSGAKTVEEIFAAIQAAPAAPAAAIRWTPVEEAMPEYDRYYLWCDRRGNIQVARYKQDIPDHFFPSQGYFTLEDAVAWAPLPVPYKGEEEEA